LKPSTVLVVDDDRDVLGLLEYWLAEAGYDVVACSRFEAARTYLSTHVPDALVTDVRLGAFNGLQLALLVSQTGLPTAVLLMSAYDDPLVRRDASACGGRFLLKPVDRDYFLTELGGALATSLRPV
jgi:two-component system response regulator GlrR